MNIKVKDCGDCPFCTRSNPAYCSILKKRINTMADGRPIHPENCPLKKHIIKVNI